MIILAKKYQQLLLFYYIIILGNELTDESNLSALVRPPGARWQIPPKHIMLMGQHGYQHKWKKSRFEYVLVKDPTEQSYYPTRYTTNYNWNKVERVVQEVLHEMENLLLEVRALHDPITIPRSCLNPDGKRNGVTFCKKDQVCQFKPICHDLDVPERYAQACWIEKKPMYTKGSGSDSDFVVFVGIKNCSELANSIPCQNEPQFDRPVAGRVAICDGTVKNPNYERSRLKDILMHELFHMFLYPMSGNTYRNPQNNYQRYIKPFTIEHRKWKSAEGLFDRHFFMSSLPTVIDVVREHFNCPYLRGADLHNDSDTYDNAGRPGHLDDRLFPDSLMSSVYYPGNQLSKLDVAFYIDSGWYIVNQSMGRPLTTTRGKGCDFALRSCYEFMENTKRNPSLMYPYCQEKDKKKWACSADFRKVGYCDGNKKSDEVDPPFRLGTGKFYGLKSRSFCPMVTPPSHPNGYDTSPLCQEGKHVEYEPLGAVGGNNSICLPFADFYLQQTKPNLCPKTHYADIQGVCVSIECKSNGSFMFKFGGQKFSCSKETLGKIINQGTIVSQPYGCRMSAKIYCPNFDVCSRRNEKYFDGSVVTVDIGCTAYASKFIFIMILLCNIVTIII